MNPMPHRRFRRPGRLAGALLIAAAFALTASPAFAKDLWLHVAVDEGPEGARVRVNLPLSMAETAIGMIPEQEMRNGRIRIDESDITIAELRQLWGQLESSPDATFVEVEEADERVQVSKSAGYLLVTVQGTGGEAQQVEARIPAAVVDALLSGEGEELDLIAAVQALAAHGAGELVAVTDDATQVRVWVDGLAEMR
jgi:hypothetical protein